MGSVPRRRYPGGPEPPIRGTYPGFAGFELLSTMTDPGRAERIQDVQNPRVITLLLGRSFRFTHFVLTGQITFSFTWDPGNVNVVNVSSGHGKCRFLRAKPEKGV